LQNLQRDYQLTISNIARTRKSISYYDLTAIKQAEEITETALRLFQAGQVSYIETLRNVITAYQTKLKYLETIRDFNQAVTELRYLTGNF
jgi:cobalt-zinc-cadmium resistance protein CzcA